MATRLTYQQVKAIKDAGRYSDGLVPGLTLLVKASGRKSWVQRLMVVGKRRDLGLGSFPDVSLAAARERATENRSRVAEGQDPISGKGFFAPPKTPARRRLDGVQTFEDVARATHARLVEQGRINNPKNIDNWLNRAKRYLFDTLGDLELDEITTGMLLDLLEPIHAEKPETAKQLRMILKRTFSRARARGIIEGYDPTADLADELGPRKHPVKHMKTLPFDQLADALALIDDSAASQTVRCAIRFMALTGVRSAEVRSAEWVDLHEDVWEIPAEKMKQRQGHTVPFSRQSKDILAFMRATYGDDTGYIFASTESDTGMLSENTFPLAFKRCGIRAVPHGLRSTLRTWIAETYGMSMRDAGEMILGHKTGTSVEQIYNRAEYMSQRRTLLQAWADYLDS